MQSSGIELKTEANNKKLLENLKKETPMKNVRLQYKIKIRGKE